MIVSVACPNVLTIADELSPQKSFGGNQEWYAEDWGRKAGCGPTCAANITAYLALTRPALRRLYAGDQMSRGQFAAHMETLFRYVTPGSMGLNRLDMYTQGMDSYTKSLGLRLQAHVFDVPGNLNRARPSADALADFVQAGLVSDCPLAFLNLSNGKVRNLQGWHWITITGADMADGVLLAQASDEGREIRFDLRLWFLTTRMRGGLIYFTED